VQSCSQPAGYVSLAGDCLDTNASVHPGTAETCNGLDDDCNGTIDDGFPGPGVPTLVLSRSGADVTLSWTPAGGVAFDVIEGTLADVSSYHNSVKACLASRTTQTSLLDPNVLGGNTWYLLREVGCGGGVGTYNDAPGLFFDRDGQIAGAPIHCP